MSQVTFMARKTINISRTAQLEPEPRRGRPVREWTLVEITGKTATV